MIGKYKEAEVKDIFFLPPSKLRIELILKGRIMMQDLLRLISSDKKIQTRAAEKNRRISAVGLSCAVDYCPI